MDLRVDETRTGEVLVISLAGKMDAISVAIFNQRFVAAIGGGERRFVVDMSGLDYISSAGLRGILTAVKKCEATGGRLCLNGLHGMVRDAFELSGFLRYFETFACREDALTQAAAP